ncbi:hypothetical protein [Limnohabitans sp. Rim8]|uniref:hypothetical protein n=1 Tax=Limnohabitans sp. Rim8 TaxID=1100718 RepID=UPI0026330C3F|nr:hypothetical protein [Limnohabitans sp. Rim8]
MLPGPIRLYSCGSCFGLFSRRTLASGNTFGAQYRSDGQMKARMLPQTPPLVVCPHCQALFCMLGAKHAIEFRNYFPGWGFLGEPTPEEVASKKAQEALAQQYKDVPHYELASNTQCLEYVQSHKMAENEERLRLYAWHRVNDERMDSPRNLSAAEAQNLQSLLMLWDTEEDDAILIKAEMLRELGQFAAAAAVLDHDFSAEAEAQAEQIMQAIERQDDQPFILAPNRDDGDIEFAWAWQARRHPTEVPQFLGEDSFDPPLFQVNNRDWWVKVLGMMSHNWALIEPQNPSGAVVYFFHDLGTALRPNGFKLKQIKGRSAVVDSLSFDSLPEAEAALRNNHFERLVLNPGPWLGFEPTGHFYDARATEEGIYSRKGYWR